MAEATGARGTHPDSITQVVAHVDDRNRKKGSMKNVRSMAAETDLNITIRSQTLSDRSRQGRRAKRKDAKDAKARKGRAGDAAYRHPLRTFAALGVFALPLGSPDSLT
jgi:hypothetical protein